MHRPLNGAVPERSEGGAQLKGVEATFHALRLRPSTAATGFSLAGEVEGRPPLRALAAGFSLAGEVEGRPPLRALAAGFSIAGEVEGWPPLRAPAGGFGVVDADPRDRSTRGRGGERRAVRRIRGLRRAPPRSRR